MQRWTLIAVSMALLCQWCLPTQAADPMPEDLLFKADCDGTDQRYVQVLPDAFDATKPHDVLIALHGHGSDRWQFVRDPRAECRAARDVARKYQMIYISPDYRARTSWMGPQAEADLVQIIAILTKSHAIDRVFIAGGSMGGTAALTFAALHPDLIAGVASMNGTANLLEYTQFQEAIQQSFGGTKAAIPDEYKRRSAEYWPERLTMPVGITTGGKDTLVPPDSVERLAGVLKLMDRPVTLIRRDATGHETNYEDGVAILEFAISHAKPVVNSGR
ncbi:MAG: alpha/beta fold hydrolase [Planctomycetes bacterium]|nr:alpha/beta fold hydrolase [Planctomycetota bacterium]